MRKKVKLGSRQKFLLGCIYEEPFITYEEICVEYKTSYKGRKRIDANGLAITLNAMESRGWIFSKGPSYKATRVGVEAYLSEAGKA